MTYLKSKRVKRGMALGDITDAINSVAAPADSGGFFSGITGAINAAGTAIGNAATAVTGNPYAGTAAIDNAVGFKPSAPSSSDSSSAGSIIGSALSAFASTLAPKAPTTIVVPQRSGPSTATIALLAGGAVVLVALLSRRSS